MIIKSPSGAGKSSICYSLISQFQKDDPNRIVAYFDAEQCLAQGTKIFNADTMTNSNIEDLVGKEFSVFSNSVDNTIIKQKATAVYKGEQIVYKLSASRGHSIEATDEHMFLTQNGYKELKDIVVGDTLYTPRKMLSETMDTLSQRDKDLYRLVGLHLGDGTKGQASISNIDQNIINDIKNIVETHLNSTIVIQGTDVRIVNVDRKCYKLNNIEEVKKWFLEDKYTLEELAKAHSVSRNVFKQLLIRHDIVDEAYNFRKHSEGARIRGEKRTPLPKREVIDKASEAYHFLSTFPTFSLYAKKKYLPPNLTLGQLSQVLAGYFMADGTVATNKSKICFSMSTSSKDLAYDLKTALLRFGITSQTYIQVKKKEDGSYYDPTYTVTSSGLDNAQKFLNSIPIYSYKKDNLLSAITRCTGTNDKKKYLNELVCLKVKNIQEVGVKPVYDISVANLNFLERNFIANGIITHNCVSIPYMQDFGVDIKQLDFQQLSVAEEVLTAIDAYAESGACSLIVLDSIPAMLTKAQLEKGIEGKTMGGIAGVMTPALTRIKDTCKRTNTTLVMINQVRSSMALYGPAESLPGGNALVFFASMMLRVSRKDSINEGDKVVGNEIQVAFKKNKLGEPYKVVTTKLLFGKGFDFYSEYFDIAVDKGIIARGGAWYTIPLANGETIKFQGKPNCVLHYKSSDTDFENLKKLVKESGGIIKEELPPEEQNEDGLE